MLSSPSIIVADIGNSALKLARVQPSENGQPRLFSVRRTLFGEVDATALESWAPAAPCKWFVASVHQEKAKALFQWISEHRHEHRTKELKVQDLPLQVAVDAPNRVGIDRLLTAVAANQRRSPDHAAITITAGTAITVNAIDTKGVFQGGVILPGATLMGRTLFDYTRVLPLVQKFEQPSTSVGKNTNDAVHNGIYLGLQGAIEKIVFQFRKMLGRRTEIFIAGGDSGLIQAMLGEGTLAPDMVLEGAAMIAMTRVPKT